MCCSTEEWRLTHASWFSSTSIISRVAVCIVTSPATSPTLHLPWCLIQPHEQAVTIQLSLFVSLRHKQMEISVLLFRSSSSVDQALEMSVISKASTAAAGTLSIYTSVGLSLAGQIPTAGTTYTFISDSTGNTWTSYPSSFVSLVMPGTFYTGATSSSFSLTACPAGTYSSLMSTDASSSAVCSSCLAGSYASAGWRSCDACPLVS